MVKAPFNNDVSFSSYEEYVKKIKELKKIRNNIDKNHEIRVTDHAVARYIERTGDHGVIRGDMREIIREKISKADIASESILVKKGIKKAWITNDSYFVIKDNTVITFIDKS